MPTIIYCNRSKLYPTPGGLEEKHDYFRQNPTARWVGNPVYEAAFSAIYGYEALIEAKQFTLVPENRDENLVNTPRFEIEVKSARPSDIPSGSDPAIVALSKRLDEWGERILKAIGEQI